VKNKRLFGAAGLILMVAIYVAACNRSLLYRGDGHLSDAGIGAAADRYVLDLGHIDLTNRGEYRFLLAGLPSTTMTIGFQVGPSFAGEKTWQTKPLDARVEMKLNREDGSLVIIEGSRLPTWVWSYRVTDLDSFVYRGGKDERVDLGNGSSTYRLLGVRADGGWGSYFDPRSLRRYRLAVRVLEPMTGRRYPVRLLIKGGGWK